MPVLFSSLRYRIIISVVVIEIVMLSIMVWSNASQVRQTHRDRLDQSAQVILQQFAATAGRFLFEVDHPSLQEYADSVLTYEELAYLLVEDADGNLITAAGNVPPADFRHVGGDDPRGDIYHVSKEVILGSSHQGAVQLGFTTSVMDAAVTAALRRGTTIAAIEIALSILAALLIGTMLTRNLSVLARFAQRYGEGEYDLTVPITSRDETGMVAKAFNDMMQQRRAADDTRRESEARQAILQNKLLRASRLSAMGHVSAQIAHEINQPLVAILNYLQAGRRMIGPSAEATSEQVREVLEKAIEQAKRTTTVIRNIRKLVERDESDVAIADINETVVEAVELALVGMPDGAVSKNIELATGLPKVVIDRTQIHLVILNLVRNAVEAMAETPVQRLTVETSSDGAGFVEIRVSDTGTGIAPDVAARLFTPFVSTKKDGMGIGLSISHSFVEAHGGRLTAAPNQDGGATFNFTLPIAHKKRMRDAA